MTKNIIDHIAFATTNSDKAMEIFKVLGFTESVHYKKNIDKFSSKITKLQAPTGEVIELVEPDNENSVVSRILKDHKANVYHSAFLVDDIQETLDKLTAIGAIIITEPMAIPYPATPAHENYMTSHIFHPYVGLFEITGPMKKQANELC